MLRVPFWYILPDQHHTLRLNVLSLGVLVQTMTRIWPVLRYLMPKRVCISPLQGKSAHTHVAKWEQAFPTHNRIQAARNSSKENEYKPTTSTQVIRAQFA